MLDRGSYMHGLCYLVRLGEAYWEKLWLRNALALIDPKEVRKYSDNGKRPRSLLPGLMEAICQSPSSRLSLICLWGPGSGMLSVYIKESSSYPPQPPSRRGHHTGVNIISNLASKTLCHNPVCSYSSSIYKALLHIYMPLKSFPVSSSREFRLETPVLISKLWKIKPSPTRLGASP